MPKLSFDGVPVMAIVGADGKDLKEYIMEVNQLYSEYQVQNDNQEATLTALNNIRDVIQERGPKRAIMASLESMGFGSLNPDYPLASYTERFSATNYQVSLEEIDYRRAGIIAALIAAGLGIVYKMVKWISNRFFGGDDSGGDSGGGGGGGSSSSSSGGLSGGGRVQQVIANNEKEEKKLIEKIEGLTVDLEGFTKDLASDSKDLDEKYKSLQERMKEIMYTKWADFYINPVETNLFDFWRKDSRSLLTDNTARGISSEFRTIMDQVDIARGVFTQVFTQMEQQVAISSTVAESVNKDVGAVVEAINKQYDEMILETAVLPKMVAYITKSFGTRSLYSDFTNALKTNNGIAEAAQIVMSGIKEAGAVEVRNPGWTKLKKPADLAKRILENSNRYSGDAEKIGVEIKASRAMSAKTSQILNDMHSQVEAVSKKDTKGLDPAILTGYMDFRVKFASFRSAVTNVLAAINCMLSIICMVEENYLRILKVTENWINAACSYSDKKNTIRGEEITDPATLALLGQISNGTNPVSS